MHKIGDHTQTKRTRTPKTLLRLPDLEQSKSSVINSLTAPRSPRSSDHAICEFIEWYCSEPRLAFNTTVVTRFRISLEEAHYASATINPRLAAVRRLAYEADDIGTTDPCSGRCYRRVKGAKSMVFESGIGSQSSAASACSTFSNERAWAEYVTMPLL